MRVYKSSVKRLIVIVLCFIVVAFFCVFYCTKQSADFMPGVENNTIMVITRYPGVSAGDVESEVTRPLENSLHTVEHLKHIYSKSRENISIITLEFESGYEIDALINDVRYKLETVMPKLPDGVMAPIISNLKTGTTPVMILSVKANESMPALYKILDDNIVNPLACIKGVDNVSIVGAPKREVNIYMDPNKMNEYNITIETVSARIGAENRNIPGGSFDVGSNTYPLRVKGEFLSPAEMENIIVGTDGRGAAVCLRDVAIVVDGIEENAPKVFTNGQQGAMIIIQKQSGGNSVEIANAVKEMLPELQKRMPSDIEIGIIQDTSDNIPMQDSGNVCATLELPIGTRVGKAERVALELTNKWMERYGDDMKVCSFSVGQADDENTFAAISDNGSRIISFNMRFVPVTEREKSLSVICDEIRADIRMCPEIARSNVSQSGGGGMGGENRASFEIYGHDFAVTDDLAQELKGRLSTNTDIFSQVNISRAYQLEYQVEFDREKLALHGIELSYAAMSVRNVRNYINGVFVTKFCEDGDEYKVKVHYVPEFRNKIYTIENIVLIAPTGAKIRIKEVANVVRIETPSTIERKDRSRIVTVDVVMAAGVALKDGIEFGVECIRDMTIPTGYSIQVANSH